MHLTSREEQKRRAIRASFNPTIPDLNKDRQVRAAAPFLGSMGDTFTAAIPRPSDVTGRRYPKVSQAIFTRVREALSGRASPREAIDALARDLREIRGAGW
jgi:trehalose/maltose transport system substrate-binding protein